MQEELLLKRPHGSLQRMYVGSDHSHKSRLIEIEIGRYGRYVITETFCASALGRGRRWSPGVLTVVQPARRSVKFL